MRKELHLWWQINTTSRQKQLDISQEDYSQAIYQQTSIQESFADYRQAVRKQYEEIRVQLSCLSCN